MPPVAVRTRGFAAKGAAIVIKLDLRGGWRRLLLLKKKRAVGERDGHFASCWKSGAADRRRRRRFGKGEGEVGVEE